jgi:hypothetical protein
MKTRSSVTAALLLPAGQMPAYGETFGAGEIEALVAHIRSLKK